MMKWTTNAGQRVAVRRSLAAVVVAAGLAVAGCADSPRNAAGGPPLTALAWTRSMCQALYPAFSQLTAPPQPDVNNPAEARRAIVTYLTSAAGATQQTIDRFSSIGAPPVANGQQLRDRISNQLVQLRTNLTDAASQLAAGNPSDSPAIEQAFGAAGNVVRLVGVLASYPELRAAIDQAPECQNLIATSGRQ